MVTTSGVASDRQFLLVEPISKTPYPPLGLMKISSMLRDKHAGCQVFSQVGQGTPSGLTSPRTIFITSLFTWDWKRVEQCAIYYRRAFPQAHIKVGGISATLLSEEVKAIPGVELHTGLYTDAEFYPPDYSLTFGRKTKTSITVTSRGCDRNCKFCSVRALEPEYFVKDDWTRDVAEDYPQITFWDNNFLASPNFEKDCERISQLGKRVDFNQGLDARLYREDQAKALSAINLDPIRFAFDDVRDETSVIRAIRLAKKSSTKEIRVYVLYNFEDTPEDLFYRLDLLNREQALAFPMEYRDAILCDKKFPGPHWNTYLLRAFKLSLLFYYRKGLVTESRESFESIYGKNAKEFVAKLYDIYMYDKALRRPKSITPEGETT